MRAIISGASGYVGGAIAEAFQGAGWEVQPPCGESGKSWRMPEDPLAFPCNDVLVHAAWDMRPTSEAGARRVNVEGSRNILRVARESGVPRLVFISSMSSFPGCASIYGRMKLEVEADFLRAGGIIVRPGLVYGSSPGGMVGKLLRVVRASPVLPIPCAGARQYLIQENALTAFLLKAGNGKIPAGVYSLAHPEPLTLAQIVKTLAHSTKRHTAMIPVPWRMAWLGLKMFSACGVRLPFSADNLVGLAKPNPAPDFSAIKTCGLDIPAFPAGLGEPLK